MSKILYTGGTFDCFHFGHTNFLRQCKQLVGRNGLVVVSLNTDEFIKEFKGKTPLMSYKERKAVLEGCRYVDLVVVNVGGKDSKKTIEIVRPDIVAIGTDWARKNYYKQMMFTQEWLDERGILLVYLPYKKGISTTALKERLKNA